MEDLIVKDSSPDPLAWFRSLTDTQQERVLARLRDVAQFILAEHAKAALTQRRPQRNIITAN